MLHLTVGVGTPLEKQVHLFLHYDHQQSELPVLFVKFEAKDGPDKLGKNPVIISSFKNVEGQLVQDDDPHPHPPTTTLF